MANTNGFLIRVSVAKRQEPKDGRSYYSNTYTQGYTHTHTHVVIAHLRDTHVSVSVCFFLELCEERNEKQRWQLLQRFCHCQVQ